MAVIDYIPQGLVVAFGGIVSYVFRNHVKQDETQSGKISDALKILYNRQLEISDKMAENHTEILQTLLRDKRT